MQAYSQDLRERILRALARGERLTEIALRFEVSRIWVYQVRKRVEQTGERSSFQVGGYRQSRLARWKTRTNVKLLRTCDAKHNGTAIATYPHRTPRLEGAAIAVPDR